MITLIILTVAPVLVTILPPMLVLTAGIAKCAGNGFTAYYDHVVSSTHNTIINKRNIYIYIYIYIYI